MTSFPPISRTPAFAWACAALVGGSLAAALLLAARRPLRGLADGFLSMPPLRRALAVLVVAAAVAYAGGKGEGAGGEGVSSKEKGVSAEFSSSVVAGDGIQQDVALHTSSLLLPPYYLNTCSLPFLPYSLSAVAADGTQQDVGRSTSPSNIPEMMQLSPSGI